MLRCINNEKVPLYSLTCERAFTKQLLRANLLLCLNCLKEKL